MAPDPLGLEDVSPVHGMNGRVFTDPSPNRKFAPPLNGEPQHRYHGLDQFGRSLPADPPSRSSFRMAGYARTVPYDPPTKNGASHVWSSWLSMPKDFAPTMTVFDVPLRKSRTLTFVANIHHES